MIDKSVNINVLLTGQPLRLSLAADDSDCKTLAERFGWLDVASLTAELKLKAIAKGAYHVSGRIDAKLSQACRLSGDAVEEVLTITVDERFIETGDDDAEIDPMAMSVEVLEGDAIPIGEMIAQLVGLEASAWPQSPDADTGQYQDISISPFASLAQLKKRR